MTDVLATIDATINDWEASPHSWTPGDPLHDRPHGAFYGEQHVRPMYELLPETSWVRLRCRPCEVTWAGPEPCWVCGVDRPAPPERSKATTHDVTVSLSASIRPSLDGAVAMRTAMASLREQMQQGAERNLADLEQLVAASRRFDSWSRPAMSRCFLLPAVADSAAPTRAELEAAADLGDLVLGFDIARPDLPPVVAVVRRPPLRHRPVRLPIDGHAYRRRTRARAHRRNR